MNLYIISIITKQLLSSNFSFSLQFFPISETILQKLHQEYLFTFFLVKSSRNPVKGLL